MSLHDERMADPIYWAILGWPMNNPDDPSSYGEDEARLVDYYTGED
jgi:hypothetical protein